MGLEATVQIWVYFYPTCPCSEKAELPFGTSVGGQGVISNSTSWSTSSPTSPGKGFALATLSWLSPIRRPRLW